MQEFWIITDIDGRSTLRAGNEQPQVGKCWACRVAVAVTFAPQRHNMANATVLQLFMHNARGMKVSGSSGCT